MHNNRVEINRMLAAISTASLFGRYNPGTSLINKVGVEDPVNRWIRNEAEEIFGVRTGCGIGHNDGVVPARDIQKYEWFENGELIAVVATPSLFFGEGQHDVALRVTAGCNGLTDEDEVTFFLASNCP